MKFDDLVNKLLNEDESLDIWHKAQMDKEAKGNDFIDMIKSMPTEQLTGLFREDLHIYYERIKGTASEDQAQDRITDMGNELLSRGVSSDELATIRDEAETSSNKHLEDEYEHKGWPGDGSGEDDFADYNQMEGNDY